MQDRHASAATICLVAVSAACAAGESESSGVFARPDSASVASAAPDELGEVVQEMSDSLWVVFQDSKNRHWFGSEREGVYRFDGKTLVRFTLEDRLAEDHIWQIQEDASGNLFFDTWGGVSKFDGQRFRTLVPVDGTWKSEPGDLWFTHAPYRYDGTTLFRLMLPTVVIEDVAYSFDPSAPWTPFDVYTIHRDRRGALWFGTAVLGACRYDGSSFDWITEDDLTELHNGPSFGVRGIVEDKEGKFWLSNLLHRYDAHPDGAAASAVAVPWYTRERGLVENGEKDEAGNANFMSGLTDRHGVSWVATYGAGVWRIDGEQLTHYPVLVDGQPITIFSIYEDREGVLWLGTHANGAWRFDGKSFERFRP